MKKEKEIHAGFFVAPHTANVIAIGRKCLVKMEKALNLYKIF